MMAYKLLGRFQIFLFVPSNILRNSRNVLASVDGFKQGLIDFYESNVKDIILEGQQFISCITIICLTFDK